jgi:hypothetical protein
MIFLLNFITFAVIGFLMLLIQYKKNNDMFDIIDLILRIVCFSLLFSTIFYIAQVAYQFMANDITVLSGEVQIHSIILDFLTLFTLITYSVLLMYTKTLYKKANYLLDSFYELIKNDALIHVLSLFCLMLLKNSKDIFNGIIGAYVFFIIVELSSKYKNKIKKSKSLKGDCKKHVSIFIMFTLILFNNYLIKLIVYASTSNDIVLLKIEIIYVIMIFVGKIALEEIYKKYIYKKQGLII